MTLSRVVITGVGLTCPIGNSPEEFRRKLLAGEAGGEFIELRYIGRVPAGVCHYDALRHQTKKELRVGTRVGSISIYAAREALGSARIDLAALDPTRVGVFLGITEHGTVETEHEVFNISQFKYETRFWSHYHNPRTVANNPAGEVSLNLRTTGPAYTIGAACAAGNLGLIHAAQMLQLREVDLALAGGVSESVQSFGIFAGFKSQGALASHEDARRASRPFDRARNGIVVAEGGCIYTLERLEDALARGATILAEIAGWCVNSDATDYVLPNPVRQAECMRGALRRAGLAPADIHVVSTHATATPQGDIQECQALADVFHDCPETHINNTKSYLGHAMGAAGALELAGNLPSFADRVVHPTINVEDLDPQCALPGLVIGRPRAVNRVDAILNNSFGMLGINSALIVSRFPPAQTTTATA